MEVELYYRGIAKVRAKPSRNNPRTEVSSSIMNLPSALDDFSILNR